jgi:ABC-type uncharacterized transport system involved in gliding motility auxiliary subunit
MTLTPRLVQISGALGVAFAVAGAVGYATAPQGVWIHTVLLLLSVLHLGVFFVGHFEGLRSFSARRSTRMGANSVLIVLLFVAILAILNFIVARHPLRFDLSASGAFTLSPQTIKLVKGLEKEVRFLAFFPEGGDKTQAARELFEAYRFQSRKVSYEVIDPDKHPQMARQYNITQYETVVLESGKRTVTAKEPTESGLTAALIQIGRDSQKTVYFVEGHGEHLIGDDDRGGYSAMKQAMEGQGFAVKPLLLLGGGVPADAAVVVVGGPRRPFAPEERDALSALLQRGGRLFALIDPSTEARLDALLLEWGVTLSDDLVVDPTSGLGGTIPIVVPGSYPPHAITRPLFDLATFYPAARSVAPATVAGLRFDPIIQTGKNSWRTTQTEGEIVLDPERDQPGPVTLGAAIQKRSPQKEGESPEAEPASTDGGARLVVIGDSDFATNAVAQSAGNGDLFQNVVSWLADEGDLVSIRSQEAKTSTLLLSMQQGITLFIGSVLLFPLAILVWGITVWRRRRRL